MDKDQRKATYRAFVSRQGSQAIGTVSWPEAKQGALKGMKLLSTGVLETVERETLNTLLADCSGHVMSTMSKKLDVLIVGRDAGPTKLQKAEEWGIKQMGEEEFHEFLKEKLEKFDGQDEAEDEAPKKPAAKRAQKKKEPVDEGDEQPAEKKPLKEKPLKEKPLKEKPAKKEKK